MNSKAMIIIAILSVLSIFSFASAQSGVTAESSVGSHFGVGGRAVGMSEAVLATVNDGTAIVYNPAGLVRIKRAELYSALSHERVKIGAGDFANDFTKTRFSSLNLTVPVPTYRGSLVVAFGVNRTGSFDRTFGFKTSSTFPGEGVSALEEAFGGIREWTASGAIELSPRLAVGTSLIFFHGRESYYWSYAYPGPVDQRIVNTDIIESRFTAVGARLGIMLELNRHLSTAFTLETPTKFNIEQDYSQRTVDGSSDETVIGYYEYDLSHPFQFRGGVALNSGTFTVEGDVGYVDWSQLEYKGNIELDSLNRVLRDIYDAAFQFRFGAEYVVPQYGFVLRGGFQHDPLPFSGLQLSNQIEKDRNSFSFGVGFLIDRVVMVDAAYARANYTLLDGDRDLSQKYTSDKLLVSIGYRI